jgi:acyl-CoA thioesterase-1
MARRRTAAVAFALLGLVCVTGGCSTSSPESNTPSTASSSSGASSQPRTWSLVALGDSVPRGTNCDCTPYPSLSADGLTKSTGHTVKATNDSVAGATTASVLQQLKSDHQVMSDVRGADVVEIEVGANDVAYKKSCGTTADCYAPGVAAVEKNLAAIVTRVGDLTSGHKHLVVLLDYWSAWLGGTYATAKGEDYVDEAARVTDEVDDVIKSIAGRSGSAYVDLRAAFKGPNYAYDETHYLSNDGDHPNSAGQQKIAQATEAVIRKALHI